MNGAIDTFALPLKLTIGIVGFGNFGQFLGRFFAAQGHRVIGLSRGDYAEKAAAIGCQYVRHADLLMDQKPNVVVFCTSIMSLDTVISNFPVQRLVGVLVADVLSVKLYPHDLFLKYLPTSTQILCTHPMFGPESGATSWEGLPFVYDIVRVSPDMIHICKAFLDLWRVEKCKMVEMTCSQHDEYAASTQFITHTTGRMLGALNVTSTPINTKGYESLLGVVETTCKDSYDLFFGLYKYNPNSRMELDKLEKALKEIRAKLERTVEAEAEKKRTNGTNGLYVSSISDEILRNLISRTKET